MNFVPLHIRTGYSFLKSSIRIEKLFEKAKNLGYEALGLCDLSNFYALPKFDKCAKSYKFGSIYGTEIKIESNILSFYALNEEGYRNINKIISLSSKKSLDYKEITFEDIKEYNSGIALVISTDNEIFNAVNEKLKEYIKNLKNLYPIIYIGIEIYDFKDKAHIDLIRDFALSNNINTFAFPKIYYLNKEEAISLDILKAIEENTQLFDNLKPTFTEYYLKSEEEYSTYYTKEELSNTKKFLLSSDFVFNKPRGELIHYLSGNEKETSDYFIKLINEGAKKRDIDVTNPIYKNRLNKEYVTIKKLGYINYFLVVQDYVNFAKSNSIPVGPGRGSAAGSLISYCLGITDVNPIKYNLLFERFLNIKRNSMPDIDIDISDVRRDEVIAYLANKYGSTRVARVAAFQTIAAKQALRDTARVLNTPSTIINDLSKAIPNNFKDESSKNFSLDYAYQNIPAFKGLVDSDEQYKNIFKIAHYIEGLPRQRGLHAAGIVLNEENLLGSIPCDYITENELVTQFEKDYLESQGFLKMDILGLSNLTIIDRCLKNIEKTLQKSIKMEEIPFEDPDIFKLINNFTTMGIFQLDTSASLNALLNIRPKNFLEVVATISLDRPGPMQFIPTYSRRKEGKERISYLSPVLKPILEETYGIIVYQEQIMQIAQIYSGFTFADADIFRKAISKKDRNEILKMKASFINGAIKKGHKEQEADILFEQILKFANYGFNKSHAVSYAMIACKEAYLKCKYPLQFYSSILDQQYGSNDVKFSKYLAEIKKMGIKVHLPDINHSTLRFISYDNGLLMPLLGISNMQTKTIYNIVEDRENHGKYTSFIDFVVRMLRTKDKISESQLSKLIDAGAFDSLYPNRKSLKMSIPNAIQYAQNTLFEEGKLLNDFGIKFEMFEAYDDPIDRINNEVEALGVMISDSPLNHIDKNILNAHKITQIDNLKMNVESEIIAIVRSIKSIVVKNGKDKGKPMAFLTVFDESDELDVTIFSSLWADYVTEIKENSILLIKGRAEIRNSKPSMIAREIKVIEG